MSSLAPFSSEEIQVLERINNYFKSTNMTIKDKVRAAFIIAEHELDSEQYGSAKEHENILFFYQTLGKVINKLQFVSNDGIDGTASHKAKQI